jgi:hypothetical protein
MSLQVPAEMIEQAERGSLDENDFIRVIRTSLPQAWQVVESLTLKLRNSDTPLVSFGSGPMEESCRGELLRMCAGTAIRTAVERHFKVSLLFQNCHNPAVVREGEEESKEAKEFKSPESQVKNQKPQFQHC